MTLTILGAPRTKKTSSRIVGSGPKCTACGKRTGRPFLIPSKDNIEWTKDAVRQLRDQTAAMAHAPSCKCRSCFPSIDRPAPTYIDVPVNCRALFYRDRLTGDANNYYASLADALEEAGVVTNDKLIVSWDGSRLRKDAERPRIELELTPVDDAEHTPVRRVRARATQAALPLAPPDDDVPIR